MSGKKTYCKEIYVVNKELTIDYIISLTNLYGLVHKNKVIEIYNLQNEERIDEEFIYSTIKGYLNDLRANSVEVHGDYFVSKLIMEIDFFEDQLNQRRGKPFYIPGQEELLKYREEGYFEITREYTELMKYVSDHFFSGNQSVADMLCREIHGICQFEFDLHIVFDLLKAKNISFNDVIEVNEFTSHVFNLVNITRIWENNGYTPKEMSYEFGKFELIPDDGLDVPSYKRVLVNRTKYLN